MLSFAILYAAITLLSGSYYHPRQEAFGLAGSLKYAPSFVHVEIDAELFIALSSAFQL